MQIPRYEDNIAGMGQFAAQQAVLHAIAPRYADTQFSILNLLQQHTAAQTAADEAVDRSFRHPEEQRRVLDWLQVNASQFILCTPFSAVVVGVSTANAWLIKDAWLIRM